MDKLILLPNNIVFVGLRGCPEYDKLILPVNDISSDGGASFWVPYNDSNAWEPESKGPGQILGIALEFNELFEMFQLECPTNLPSHIEYFHELQNWYFFTRGKHFIDFSTFDDEDGDKWIEITKKFLEFCKRKAA